jgi:transposase
MSFTQQAERLPPAVLAQLPDDPATLKRLVEELAASLQEARRANDALRARLDQLLRRLYGPRTERFHPDQPLLFDEPAPAAAPAAPGAAAEADAPLPRRRCRPHGRRRLPADLPRQRREHVLTEAERLCPGCGRLRIDIGVQTSEQLEYRPASMVVIEHVVHKYTCPCCNQRGPAPSAVLPGGQPSPESPPMPAPQDPSRPQPTAPAGPAASTAAAPDRPGTAAPPAAPQRLAPAQVVVAAAKPAPPIAKGLPGPGLLAHLIVSKYTDHLPLHRLERLYERQGVILRRSTLCDWLAASATLLQPLYARMIEVVLQSCVLHTDDTTVKLQDVATHRLSTARLWVYLGDWAHPYNVFDFTVNRKRDGPQQFLASYQGYLQADAFSGYDGLYLPAPGTSAAPILEVACNAHARRKFYEARGSDLLRSHQALAYYRQLYELERSAARVALDDEQRRQMRQDICVPILERFHRWLEKQRPEVLPKSPMGEALSYALNNWAALVRYTEAGYLAIDNNVAEREMKRIAIGRKNWLFVGSPQGGQTAAVLFSFTSTCQRLGVEPWAYLQDVLERLPTTPAERLGDLFPNHWQAARQGRPTPSVLTDPANRSAEPAS